MIKLVSSVFTYDKNEEYAKLSIEHYEKSLKYLKAHSDVPIQDDLLVIDFGQFDSRWAWVSGLNSYSWKPGAGFGANWNSAKQFAEFLGADYLFNFNDDAFISEEFLLKGIAWLEINSDIAIVAGIPNRGGPGFDHEIGGWNMPLSMKEIPQPFDCSFDVDPLDRLWWEAAACVYKMDAIQKTGDMDIEFDRYGGVIGDNDYFIRLIKDGYKLNRLGTMRFFHCRGITQDALYRTPISGQMDPLQKQAFDYLCRKWGAGIKTQKWEDLYERPFNKKGEEEDVTDNLSAAI